MPIGKNSIKRISNDGYSNVKTSAPDMENSTVATEKEKIEEIKVETPKKEAEKKTAPKKSSSTKANTAKKSTQKADTKAETKPAPKKSMETEPSFSPVNTAEKIIDKKEESKEDNERQGEGYVNLGGKLPYYLL